MGFIVYAMVDPRYGRIFYVGQTSDLALRRAQHLEGGDTVAGLTVREIQGAGDQPLFIQLEACPSRRRALMAEVFWIDLLSARGTSLCNTQAFEGYVDRARRKGDLAAKLKSRT
jgi:hypothetical protein